MSTQSISDDELLGLFPRYGYLTAEHVTRRYFGRSRTHVGERLKKLREDGLLTLVTEDIHHRAHSDAYIYHLTRQGQQHLARQGVPLPARFRNERRPGLHTIGVTHFFIALERLAQDHPDVAIDQLLHELDYDRQPDRFTAPDGTAWSVKPDGWARIWVGTDERCIALEYDRGTERDEKTWRAKIAKLLAWMDFYYAEHYATRRLAVAIVAAPGPRRRDQLLRMTESALRHESREDEAALFLVTDRDPATTDPLDFFGSPIWIEPFTRTTHPLLSGLTRPAP